MLTPCALGVELGGGFAAIEEGDDRIRPGILLTAGLNESYGSSLVYYGRKFGPVTERTVIVSGYYKLDFYRMLGINFLTGGGGIALMNEQTIIDLPDDSDEENNPNLGFTVGLHGDVPIPGPIFLRVGMESHVFLAGAQGLLLANGRKNIISLTSGVKF